MSKLGRYSAQRRKVEVLTGTKTLTVADCGTYFTIGSAAAVITLPTVAEAGPGWWCEFWQNARVGTTTITAPGTDLILGFVRTGVDGSVPELQPPTAEGTELITFTHGSNENGDHVALWCDGTNYFLTGMSRAANHPTVVDE